MFVFSIWIFFSRTFTNHWTAGEREGISLTPHYHFHLLHRHLDISRSITAESSPLHIANSRTQTENLWLASCARKAIVVIMITWVQCNDINYFWLRVYSLKTFSKVIRNDKSLKKILWKVLNIYCVFWYFITEQWNPCSLQQLLWVETFQNDYQTLITLLLSGS